MSCQNTRKGPSRDKPKGDGARAPPRPAAPASIRSDTARSGADASRFLPPPSTPGEGNTQKVGTKPSGWAVPSPCSQCPSQPGAGALARAAEARGAARRERGARLGLLHRHHRLPPSAGKEATQLSRTGGSRPSRDRPHQLRGPDVRAGPGRPWPSRVVPGRASRRCPRC